MRLIGGLAAGVRAVWLGAAHAVGGGVRGLTRSSTVDAGVRRDGLGLALLVVAIITAAAVWWSAAGPVFEAVRSVVAGSVGVLAYAVPVLLLLLAVRLLRDPARLAAHGGRVLVGGSLVAAGLLGLVHIAAGLPRSVEGAEAMQAAGGAVGFVVSSLLADLLTVYVAVPVLVIVFGYGVLVLADTPVHVVVERLRTGLGRLRRTPHDDVVPEGPDAYESPLAAERDDAANLADDTPARSSPCRATSPTTCRHPTCWARARPTRPAPRRTSASSTRSRACSSSSRSTPRSRATPAAPRSRATRSSSAPP